MKPQQPDLDVRAWNREAWDRQVDNPQNPWTRPVSPQVIAAARRGEWQVLLTENIPVPRHWFPPLEGRDVLCLGSGGGQQGPVLAAVGARVTVFDNSPRQLEQDRLVAEREGLSLRLVEGDMRDLSVFPDESFDLIFHPVSNVFCPEVRPVWKECYRVLRHGGYLLAGMMNPVHYIFDLYAADEGRLEVRHPIPYSDLTHLTEEELQAHLAKGLPLEFGHSLSDLLGGQCDAGFHIIGLYEDVMKDSPLAAYHPNYIATRALKP